MKRWIWPGAIVVAVAAATTAASLVGTQPVPAPPFTTTETRASLVCPAFESVTAMVRVAAVATGPGLRTAKVIAPAAATDATGFVQLDRPGVPLRVSALLPDPFGASTVVAAQTGGDRGLSAAACAAPATAHWFTGVDIRPVAQSELVVANLDQSTASVDLVGYGEEGRFSAPRGLQVEGNSVRTISLGPLPRSAGPISLAVSSSDGRVAAFVRQRTWRADAPLGADWLPASTEPSAVQVIPGIPAGAGARTLVVTNPGGRTATLTIGGLTKQGPATLVGADELEVPPESTRTVDLAPGLDGQPGSLVLTSTQPVTAGVWLEAGSGDAQHDPAYTVATVPLPADSVWPVALGRGATGLLQLANPGAADATVTIIAGTGAQAGTPRQMTVPAQSIAEVRLERAAANVVRLQTTSVDVRGALVATDRLGKVRGLTVLDLAADGGPGVAPVVFDPHAGS